MKTGKSIIRKIKKEIYSQEFMGENRFNKTNFTRKRKLPFSNIILFMLNIIKQTLQKELTNFMKLISSREINITKSAFCQSRLKLKPEAFVKLNSTLTKEFYTDNKELLWNKFRLFAIDGSTLQLPKSNEIIEEFGRKSNQYGDGMPVAQISTCYDVLNGITLDAQLAHCRTSEYKLALEHLKIPINQSLFIYDRGYSALWFMYKHIFDKKDFIIRMQRRSIKEIELFFDSNEDSKIIEISKLPPISEKRIMELGLNFKSFKIKLIKVILDSGEIEVLATSLIEDKYSLKDFKELYWKRWGIEVNYDHTKNNLQIEDFTGLSSISVKQDFFASIFILNIQSLIIFDTNNELKKNKKNTKYKYKINRRLSLGLMKDRIIKIICNDNSKDFKQLKKLFKMELVPIRPNRKNKRINRCDRKKFFINKKRAI